MIAVIDYGMGNLRSVEKALTVVGAKARITSRPEDLARAERIVFPGVGAFGEAMRELGRRRLIEPIKDAIRDGKVFLGLCLGMQLLFERSAEAPGVKGLCLLKGEVKRFKFTGYGLRVTGYGLKIPHMGWNRIVVPRPSSVVHSNILKDVPDRSYMYFVHSYYVLPKDKSMILTMTDYGIKFVSGIRKDNIIGFQFHPEKSQSLGLKVLKNFVNL